MSLLEEPLTYEDYMRIAPGDRIRYEIIDGELLWSHTPPIAHQQVAGNLLMMVGEHIHTHQPGELIIGPVDVRISTYDIVVPNFVYVRAERRTIYKATGLFDGSPDFVVETLSPETRVIDLTRKVALYARARVPEYWILDPMKRVFRLLAASFPPSSRASRSTPPSSSRDWMIDGRSYNGGSQGGRDGNNPARTSTHLP